MPSTFGTTLRVTVFGQSHSEAIGCVLDGLPSGLHLDTDALTHFIARRTPGSFSGDTPMKEIHSVFSQGSLPRKQRVELPLRPSLKIPTYAQAITTTSVPFPGRDMPILPPGASGADARTPQAADNFPDVLRRRSALPEALPSRHFPRKKFILPHILKKLPE